MQRLKHIDAMRGIAALAVIYTHVSEYGLKHDLVGPLEKSIFAVFTEYMDLGKVAVTVFFAISGFVIPFSIFKYRKNAVLSFGISRFFRLYPAYWVSIPLGLLFLFYLQDRPITPFLVISNISMLELFVGGDPILGIYWTLQIEMIFYALCAMMFAVNRLDNVRWVTGSALLFLAAAIGMSALRYRYGMKLPVALPLSLSVMFWGLSIRFAFEEGLQSWKIPLAWLTISLVLATPIVSLLAYNVDMGFHETWYKYTITYYIALALFFVFYRFFKVNSDATVYLGTISYSVYLLGFVVQEAIFDIIGDKVFALSGHGVIALCMILTVCISAVVYEFVEAPAVNFGKALIKRLNNEPARIVESYAPPTVEVL